ncbi:MAG: hypothetical protein SFW67_34620 [Myxococcaceae bacterium]|nr:hypothetical protein [Myxococcaceae bacterium]
MWLAVLPVVLAASGVRVELENCPRVELRALERQLALELARAAPPPTRVRVVCEATRAVLNAATETGETGSVVGIDDVPTVALARTLALAAAELVLHPVAAPRPAPPPPPAVPPPPALARWWLRAVGGVEGFSSLLGGGGASGAVRAGPVWLLGELRVSGGGRDFPQGRVSALSVDGLVAALVRPKLGAVLVPVGFGVRVGHSWLSASPAEGVDAGVVRGVRVAPVALLGLHVMLWERLTLGVDVQVGWALRGVQGLVDGAPAVSLVGPVGLVSLGVGVTW